MGLEGAAGEQELSLKVSYVESIGPLDFVEYSENEPIAVSLLPILTGTNIVKSGRTDFAYARYSHLS